MANEALYNIAASITTPISLAALALLVLSYVFSQIIRRNVNQANVALMRDIAKYMFIIGLLFGLTAIGALTLTKIVDIGGEIRVSGNVLDEKTKEPVFGATVSITGGPSRELNDDGSFEISLPRSRFGSGYTITVAEEEYEPQTVEVKTDLSKPHNIYLRKKVLEQSIFQQYHAIVAGHWLGRPTVQVDFTLDNANDAIVSVKDFSATLIGPQGKTLNFTGMRVNGIFPPITTKLLHLHPGSPRRIMGVFFEPNDKFLAMSFRVNQWVMNHPSTINPMEKVERLEPKLTQDLQALAKDEFFWVPGEWTLNLKIRSVDRTREYPVIFSLSDEQIDNMKLNIAEYGYGFGVLDPLLLAGTDPYHGTVRVNVSDVTKP